MRALEGLEEPEPDPVTEVMEAEAAACQPALQEKKRRALSRLLKDISRGDAQLSLVCDGLYLGSLGTASNLAGMTEKGVTHVLNVSPLVPCFFPRKLHYLQLQVYDDPEEDITQHFPAMNRFIARGRRKGGVLVHCFAGQSRSLTAVLSYLVACQGLSLPEALQLVLAAHPRACPNRGFMAQLEAYATSRRPHSSSSEQTQADSHTV